MGGRSLTPEEREQIIELHKQRLTPTVIGRTIGRSATFVSGVIKKIEGEATAVDWKKKYMEAHAKLVEHGLA